MSLRSRFFAATYNAQMRRTEKAGLTEMRQQLLAHAVGEVLEIGGGTGANLTRYPASATSLTITEPDVWMLKRLKARIRAQAPNTLAMRAPAEDLPFEDWKLRHGGLDLGALRRGRPTPGFARDPPGAATAGLAAVPRTRTRRGPGDGEEAGPDGLAEPGRRLLRLQPPHPHHHRGGRIRRHLAAADRSSQDAFLRAAHHHRYRDPPGPHGSETFDSCGFPIPCKPIVERNPTVPKISKHNASHVDDFGAAEDHHEDLDGYTVNFVTIRQDHDLGPMLKALPGGNCSCPHWGYVLKGRLTVRYDDREETVEAGEAFYMSPGHAPAAEGGTEFVQFSPADQLAATTAAMMKAMS